MAKLKLGKHMIFFVIVTLSMLAMIWFGMNNHIDFGLNQNVGVSFPTGRVLEVISDQTSVHESGLRMGRQDLLVEIISGEHRGRIVEAVNTLLVGNSVYAQVGQRLVIYFESSPGHYFARVHSYQRATGIYIVVLFLIGLMAAVFGKSGLRSAFSLIFTFVVIIFLLIPLITMGAPPALLTFGLSLCIVSVSLISIMGFEKKTYVSIAGTTIGIILYALFYLIIGWVLSITGFNVEAISTLIVIDFNVGLSELLFCAILIASLGAVMDVAVSLASVMAELSEANPKAGLKSLFTSGMKVGRDMIGSSTSTLILAFTGTFFISLLLFRLNNLQYNMLINRVDIAIEVLRAVSASAAMILCAPATAMIGAWAYTKKVFAGRKAFRRI
ncbi:MAG: YibE/F family protein [Defluviitaleaceae bacterium]|nr:YibE/F family protein [Defluviitaleaceae bacterium]